MGFFISKRDVGLLVEIFCRHNLKCSMKTLMKEFPYYSAANNYHKRLRLLKVLEFAQRELNKTIKIEIVKNENSEYELLFL